MLITLERLKQTTLGALARSGYPPDEAQIILDVLLYAQMRGNNQGVVKLIGAGMPRDAAALPIKVVRDNKLAVLLDGGRNSGMVVMRHALDVALTKAREHGIGIVGTNNTRSSTGAIGYYANVAAQAGFIAFVFSGSGEYVAMHGSYQPIFGTNPLAIGIPSSDAPIVFDMATAAMARYGIVEAQAAGRPIPDDVAFDRDGQPTTEPSAALAGAIRTFGGYKGAALALVVEIFTQALVETTPESSGKKDDWGNLILIIDPSLLTERELFEARVAALAGRVKATQRLTGVEEILLPGERGNHFYKQVLEAGAIDIEESLWRALEHAAG